MDNNQLADPNAGVAYFKNFLRPYFLKGAYNTFLYRMISFINLRKGSRDMLSFMTQFDILSRRLAAAWVELMRPPERDAEFHASLAAENVQIMFVCRPSIIKHSLIITLACKTISSPMKSLLYSLINLWKMMSTSIRHGIRNFVGDMKTYFHSPQTLWPCTSSRVAKA